MHIQALGLTFLGLWATAGCAPLIAAISRPLVESSLFQSADKRNPESIPRYANDEIRKRDDENGGVVNLVVKYTDDEMTKREDDNGGVANTVVKYTDDEMTKREDDNGGVANAVVTYTDDEMTKREDDKGGVANIIVKRIML